MTKRRLKNNIHKHRYWRKDEKLRYELYLNLPVKPQYIEPNQKEKSGYLLKKNHLLECDMLYGKEKNIIKDKIKN